MKTDYKNIVSVITINQRLMLTHMYSMDACVTWDYVSFNIIYLFYYVTQVRYVHLRRAICHISNKDHPRLGSDTLLAAATHLSPSTQLT